MAAQQWIIYWNEYTSETYLDGSVITFHKKNDVEFRNNLMPPGTVIKTWYSSTNYQLKRIEPSLPMIDGETEYQISANIDYPEGGSCLLRLVFFDKYEEEAGSMIIRQRNVRFRCPLKTFSYRMQLMNEGAPAFRFHYVTIKEVLDDDEERNQTI